MASVFKRSTRASRPPPSVCAAAKDVSAHDTHVSRSPDQRFMRISSR
jgi:hypothetical protein